jgi:ATP-dependent DNA ligase
VAFKTRGKLQLRSRNDNDFAFRYPSIAKALASLPDDTAMDGEIVALDADGKPSFNALQNYGSSKADLIYYVFDVMVLAGKDVMGEPLRKRRELLEKKILTKLGEPIRSSPALNASLAVLIQSVKAQRFEGLVAKRLDSRYQPGERSGAWQKMRVNQGQELVIAGYTPSSKNFDALVIVYYEDGKLIYTARTRNGFTPASRAEIFKKLKPLEIKECPFANLPEKKAGRWGAGLTAEKMKECRWLNPQLVGQFEFVEWTDVSHLRHTKFVALRDDKNAKDVVREK